MLSTLFPTHQKPPHPQQVTTLHTMPPEIIIRIAKQLTIKQVATLELSSSRLRHILENDEGLWEHLFQKEHGQKTLAELFALPARNPAFVRALEKEFTKRMAADQNLVLQLNTECKNSLMLAVDAGNIEDVSRMLERIRLLLATLPENARNILLNGLFQVQINTKTSSLFEYTLDTPDSENKTAILRLLYANGAALFMYRATNEVLDQQYATIYPEHADRCPLTHIDAFQRCFYEQASSSSASKNTLVSDKNYFKLLLNKKIESPDTFSNKIKYRAMLDALNKNEYTPDTSVSESLSRITKITEDPINTQSEIMQGLHDTHMQTGLNTVRRSLASFIHFNTNKGPFKWAIESIVNALFIYGMTPIIQLSTTASHESEVNQSYLIDHYPPCMSSSDPDFSYRTHGIRHCYLSTHTFTDHCNITLFQNMTLLNNTFYENATLTDASYHYETCHEAYLNVMTTVGILASLPIAQFFTFILSLDPNPRLSFNSLGAMLIIGPLKSIALLSECIIRPYRPLKSIEDKRLRVNALIAYINAPIPFITDDPVFSLEAHRFLTDLKNIERVSLETLVKASEFILTLLKLCNDCASYVSANSPDHQLFVTLAEALLQQSTSIPPSDHIIDMPPETGTGSCCFVLRHCVKPQTGTSNDGTPLIELLKNKNRLPV